MMKLQKEINENEILVQYEVKVKYMQYVRKR